MTRAIIFPYCIDHYINISCTKVERTEDLIIFYDGEEIKAIFQVSDLKGFYITEKRGTE